MTASLYYLSSIRLPLYMQDTSSFRLRAEVTIERNGVTHVPPGGTSRNKNKKEVKLALRPKDYSTPSLEIYQNRDAAPYFIGPIDQVFVISKIKLSEGVLTITFRKKEEVGCI